MEFIGIVANPMKEEALKLAEELVPWFTSRNIKVVVEGDVAKMIGRPDLQVSLESACDAEMLVVLGGDGSILRTARVAGPKNTPILGVHFGQYGFITEVHPPDLKFALERVLAGEYRISQRMMLQSTHKDLSGVTTSVPALNDVVVSKGPLSRLLNLRLSVDGRYIATYAADGIIVSSPTGSTAYSLSAGGPVVNPNVDVMIITPICPHTLNARSLVIPGNAAIQIVSECETGAEDVMLTVDGQTGFPLRCGETIDVTRADYCARIVYWDQMSFYDKLQSRLRWGERFSS